MHQIDPPREPDNSKAIFEMFKELLKSIKYAYTSLNEHKTEFKKLVQKLSSRSPAETSTEDLVEALNLKAFDEHWAHLAKKRFYNKKLAEISISTLRVYTEQVSKHTDSLWLLEKNTFIEAVIIPVSYFVVLEQSHVQEFFKAAMSVFFYEQREDPNPLQIKSKQTPTYTDLGQL